MPTPQETFDQAVRLHRSGQPAAAIPLYRALLRAAPKEAEIHHQLGNALKHLLRFEEALEPLSRAAKLAPNDAAIRLNLGVALLELRRYGDAEINFRRALALEPDRPEAHNILGNALFAQGRLRETEQSFREALRLRPDYAPAHDNLGRLHRAQGRIGEAVTHYRAALAHQPRAGTHSNLLLALNYLDESRPDEIFAEHQAWGRRYADPLSAVATAPDSEQPVADRRLRVGYVSPDFANHAVNYFFEPVLRTHDRGAFEVFCYSNVLVPDAATARVRSLAEHWRDISPLDDEQAAALIRADSLDLLIDLAGHTARNRLLVFARRPAPVQLTWIGYPNTTGMAAMDFRITDAVSDPVGQAERFYTEKLLRLSGPFSVYRPPDDAPEVGAGSDRSAVTFGCFNNFAKVTPRVIALWAQLLTSLPGSQLFLKSRGLDDKATAARIHEAFQHEGVSPERIKLDGRELSVPAHLALYHQVDVALDTFPYNGTTTTCEALWMGVPVVTLAGETHVARVGASLLSHLSAASWIAASPEDYCQKARELALDLRRMPSLRNELRERMRTSAVCDAAGFTRGLEETLAGLMR